MFLVLFCLNDFEHGAYNGLRESFTRKGWELTMLYYLIVCRTLTHAQRTAAALERTGMRVRILRSPKSISGEGCSHCVRVARWELETALIVLKGAGLMPKRVFSAENDGSYTEILL